MKKKHVILIAAVIVFFGVMDWLGVGAYSSGSAVSDLKEALESVYGEPYTGREIENGTEDMEFLIEPDTFFLTNYNLRRFFGLDYEYQCKVTYTVHEKDGTTDVRTIIHTGIDPMGVGEEDARAYIDWKGLI